MNGSSNEDRTPLRANRVLVAGIGNIFMGDDGFGCEVIRRLAHRDLPADVDVVDFGIRGMDLSYALMEGYAQAILVDAVERGGAPGSVYVIEPEIDASPVESGEQLLTPHGMDPARVLRFIASLGDRRPSVLLIACEPAYLGGEDGHMGLSESVAAAVDTAVAEVWSALERARQTDTPGSSPRQSALGIGTMHAGAGAPGGLT